MIKEQANQFIKEILGGLWPRWEPKQEEIDGWVERLLYFEYYSAKQAVNNMFFESITVRGLEPPAGKILNAIRKTQQLKTGTKSDRVLLYTIIKESLFNAGKNPKIYGKGFYVGTKNQVPAPEEIEHRAEFQRQELNSICGENHIIIRNWENFP
jgi:hypothetical protein